jgi:hypothetical protein
MQVYDKKKYNERRNSINAIQQNLREMRDETKYYINKNEFHLPLIFMARPDLYGTIDTKDRFCESSQIKSALIYKLKTQSKSIKKKNNLSACKSPLHKIASN